MKKDAKGFFGRNRVIIVCVPAIVAIHYWWFRLQYNPAFVKKEEINFGIFQTISDFAQKKLEDWRKCNLLLYWTNEKYIDIDKLKIVLRYIWNIKLPKRSLKGDTPA